MRIQTILGLLLAVPFALSPQSIAGGGDSVGSLPSPAASQVNTRSIPFAPRHKVRAGNEHTNNDGVRVATDKGSSGYATMDPRTGNDLSATNVVCRTGWEGTVSGLDQNDSVDVRSNSEGSISGNGGEVTIAGGCTVTVTNTAPTGGPNVTINTPGGTTQTIPPGSSTTIST